ncbi:MAG TPA: hypothetical protein VKE95_05965 [Burkholderiales bacterium]|nr:hypothetical protein [Burkholderiales bacterium]
MLAWQIRPAPATVIVEVACDARYVGPLQAQIAARGIGGGVMGVGDGIQCSSGYAVFSRALNLGERDLERIRASGSPYRVGLHEGSIVTISGTKGSVIAYEDYVARAAETRNRLLFAAIAALLLAAAILFVKAG